MCNSWRKIDKTFFLKKHQLVEKKMGTRQMEKKGD